MSLGSWLLKRGLAIDDYRRLGVKPAVVHDINIRTMSSCSAFLTQFYKHHFDELPAFQPYPLPTYKDVPPLINAQMDPARFCDRHITCHGNAVTLKPLLPPTALCMKSLHCCMRLSAIIHPHGVYAVLLRE